jgi:hypothetical protein
MIAFGASFFVENINAMVQEEDPDFHGQDLRLSGQDRSGGSVGRTQGPRFQA